MNLDFKKIKKHIPETITVDKLICFTLVCQEDLKMFKKQNPNIAQKLSGIYLWKD